MVAHQLKHELALPLVLSFHTLGHVKAAAGIEEPSDRLTAETRIAGCADLVLAASDSEYDPLVDDLDVAPALIEPVSPGVDPRIFPPGDREAARRRLGLDGPRVALFVGRVQPLKGLEVAVAAVDALADPSLTLVVVGGPSGPDGDAELAASTIRSGAWNSKSRFASSRPNVTRPWPTSTGQPTSAWSRRSRNRSGWWPWKRVRAPLPWWRPTWADCERSWTTT